MQMYAIISRGIPVDEFKWMAPSSNKYKKKKVLKTFLLLQLVASGHHLVNTICKANLVVALQRGIFLIYPQLAFYFVVINYTNNYNPT